MKDAPGDGVTLFGGCSEFELWAQTCMKSSPHAELAQTMIRVLLERPSAAAPESQRLRGADSLDLLNSRAIPLALEKWNDALGGRWLNAGTSGSGSRFEVKKLGRPYPRLPGWWIDHWAYLTTRSASAGTLSIQSTDARGMLHLPRHPVLVHAIACRAIGALLGAWESDLEWPDHTIVLDRWIAHPWPSSASRRIILTWHRRLVEMDAGASLSAAGPHATPHQMWPSVQEVDEEISRSYAPDSLPLPFDYEAWFEQEITLPNGLAAYWRSLESRWAGDMEQALHWIDESAALLGDAPEIRLQKIRVRQEIGDLSALRDLELLTQKYPVFLPAQEVLLSLAGDRGLQGITKRVLNARRSQIAHLVLQRALHSRSPAECLSKLWDAGRIARSAAA